MTRDKEGRHPMRENDARTRALAYRSKGIAALARTVPHHDGWPQMTGEWEVALREDATGRYFPEYDSRVIALSRTLDDEAAASA